MRNMYWHIIIYDIRSKKRLRSLHHYLRKNAYPLQESVFAWFGNADQLVQLQSGVSYLINDKEDDVRGYRVPSQSMLHLWGLSPALDGVFDSGYPPYRLHPMVQPNDESLSRMLL